MAMIGLDGVKQLVQIAHDTDLEILLLIFFYISIPIFFIRMDAFKLVQIPSFKR